MFSSNLMLDQYPRFFLIMWYWPYFVIGNVDNWFNVPQEIFNLKNICKG